MPARSPGDPRALACRYCGGRRRFVRATLVCATCDDTPRWPGGALDPGPAARPIPGGDAAAPEDEDGPPPSRPGR